MSALALKIARREILPHRALRVGRPRHASPDRVKQNRPRVCSDAPAHPVYVLNNPMSLTDPTGNLSFRQILGIAIAVVAAYFGQEWLAQDALAWSFGVSVAGGFLSAYVATGSLKAGLWGAFAAGVFWGIGTAFSDVAGGPMQDGSAMTMRFSTGSFAAKIAAHAAGGGIISSLEGGNFGSGFLAAGATESLSPTIDSIGDAPVRMMAASVVGGTVSKITGGKFANGAETAFFQELFNQWEHSGATKPAQYKDLKPVAETDIAAGIQRDNVVGTEFDVSSQTGSVDITYVQGHFGWLGGGLESVDENFGVYGELGPRINIGDYLDLQTVCKLSSVEGLSFETSASFGVPHFFSLDAHATFRNFSSDAAEYDGQAVQYNVIEATTPRVYQSEGRAIVLPDWLRKLTGG